jgi:hypothetical protein
VRNAKRWHPSLGIQANGIQALASRLWHPGFGIQALASRLWHPGFGIQVMRFGSPSLTAQ